MPSVKRKWLRDCPTICTSTAELRKVDNVRTVLLISVFAPKATVIERENQKDGVFL